MRQLAFHKSFIRRDSCLGHLGSSGFWMHCHSPGKQGVTGVCAGRAGFRDSTYTLVWGRYVHLCNGELSLKVFSLFSESLRRPI